MIPQKISKATLLKIPLHKSPNSFWAFSSGAYLSGLGPEQYSFQANVQQQSGSAPPKYDTLNYTLMDEENGKVEAGISALLHVGGYLKKSAIGLHGAIGAGLSLESKPRPRIMAGFGPVFGRHNKVALTLGWIGGPVKTLLKVYQPNQTYLGAASEIMRDKFKRSFVVSLGYALFGK